MSLVVDILGLAHLNNAPRGYGVPNRAYRGMAGLAWPLLAKEYGLGTNARSRQRAVVEPVRMNDQAGELLAPPRSSTLLCLFWLA